MSATWLKLTCRDAVISRDGRPFGADSGSRMRSTDWPLPSVIAGSLRTALGRTENKSFSVATAIDLLDVRVEGFLPIVGETLYLPAPIDCVPREGKNLNPLRAVPWSDEELRSTDGAIWPNSFLRPVAIPLSEAAEDFKPAVGPTWWPVDAFAEWTTGKEIVFGDRFLMAPDVEHRTHVKLDRDWGAAEESQLFSTAGLVLSSLAKFGASRGADRPWEASTPIQLAVRVNAAGWCADAAQKIEGLFPTGGERRLVHWRTAELGYLWTCPRVIRERLAGAGRVRMTLVTPGIFRGGWLPGWLDTNGEGSPPGSDVHLRLVGASLGRWKAVSGWSLIATDDEGKPVEQTGNRKPGPKPVRRLVPAGAVYYFECIGGDVASLADRWLESVCDASQEQRDGFGLAAWGTW